MSTYTEDHLVEQPAVELMSHELGWNVVNAYDEWSGGASNLGRDSKREVVLSGRLKPTLLRLNPELPMEGIEGAVEEIFRDFFLFCAESVGSDGRFHRQAAQARGKGFISTLRSRRAAAIRGRFHESKRFTNP